MRNILMIMKRRSFAQSLARILTEKGEYQVQTVYNYEQSVLYARQSDSAVIEVSENNEYDLQYCLGLCEQLKVSVPAIRILLLCPDDNSENAGAFAEAKRNKRIDDFAFYDSSLKDLLIRIDSLR